MHWSRELLALTAGVRWRIAGLVVIGLLIVAASLASFVFAGRAIAAVFAGRALIDFWFLIAGAAAAAVLRGVLLHLRETAGERTAAAVKQALRTRLYRHLLVLGPGYLERRRTGELVASAVDGVEQLETYYGKYLPQLLVTVLAPIGHDAYTETWAEGVDVFHNPNAKRPLPIEFFPDALNVFLDANGQRNYRSTKRYHIIRSFTQIARP